ncbi:MAG: hypothetical protein WCF75_02810 [Pseudolabrys sp.]
MLGLTDDQLGTVMDMAHTVPVEKRDLYLQRVAAMLAMRGRGHFGDDDVQDHRRGLSRIHPKRIFPWSSQPGSWEDTL